MKTISKTRSRLTNGTTKQMAGVGRPKQMGLGLALLLQNILMDEGYQLSMERIEYMYTIIALYQPFN